MTIDENNTGLIIVIVYNNNYRQQCTNITKNIKRQYKAKFLHKFYLDLSETINSLYSKWSFNFDNNLEERVKLKLMYVNHIME